MTQPAISCFETSNRALSVRRQFRPCRRIPDIRLRRQLPVPFSLLWLRRCLRLVHLALLDPCILDSKILTRVRSLSAGLSSCYELIGSVTTGCLCASGCHVVQSSLFPSFCPINSPFAHNHSPCAIFIPINRFLSLSCSFSGL